MTLHLINGFLGSGKTTAIQTACKVLTGKDKTVAVITNDQGHSLVDSKVFSGDEIPFREVIGGCFCCNYSQLSENISQLIKTVKPVVLFAESVGSCTDLVATVAKPILKERKDLHVTISGFVDASLLFSLIQGNTCFLDETVQYILRKQLEESDLIVVNKIDLVTETELSVVRETLESEYPGKPIIYQASLTDEGIKPWLNKLQTIQSPSRVSLEIDYDMYGAGEAKLGWLDQELIIRSNSGNAYELAFLFAERLHKKIRQHQYPIGHLKFYLDDGKQKQKISYTTTDRQKNMELKTKLPSQEVNVLINARVQALPSQINTLIRQTMDDVISAMNCTIESKSLSAFQPGYPRPLHRITE